MPLKLVDRSNTGVSRQQAFQQIDLSVVGRDDQNVGHPNPSFLAVAIAERLAEKTMVRVTKSFGFLPTGLAVADVEHRREAQASRRQGRYCAGEEQ